MAHHSPAMFHAPQPTQLHPAQQTANPAALAHHHHQQQQQQQQHREAEYFYVYVAESEYSSVGFWIMLEPDKTLSLQNLRGYFTTCFGIKHKFVNARNELENRYVRYHNGFFRFQPGLDLNNTRFVAYYYNDVEDVKAFMDMAEANDAGVGGGSEMPAMELGSNELVPPEEIDATLGRTMNNFDMEAILKRGAQSTPKVGGAGGGGSRHKVTLENVSSTSDVILNEPPVEVISVQDSQDLQHPPLPPPPGPPASQSIMPAVAEPVPPSNTLAPSSSGIISRLGPSVSSTSDEQRAAEKVERIKHERITINDSSGFQRGDQSSKVMIRVEAAPKTKNMLNRYQMNRAKPEDVNEKTPLKITLKPRGRQIQRNTKILKIEDEKGRTTALLTKKKWAGKAEPGGPKRRAEPYEEFRERPEKNRRYDAYQQPRQYYQDVDVKPAAPINDDYYRMLNVLLVGFNTEAPIISETSRYFGDFGIVQNIQLFTQDNRQNLQEYYAFMKIRTNDAVSLFSDRHLYNGTVIYAIRVDGNKLPPRLKCRVCGHFGIKVGYLHYHLEGQFHQGHLQKRLESLARTIAKVYVDSYYRISYDELYVQYPSEPVQTTARDDYWKRSTQPSTYSSAMVANPSSNRYYNNNNRERYY